METENIPSMIGYIADQAPIFEGIHLFLDFLNHDTPVLTGHERISKMLHATVVYGHMSRPKRGEYVCKFVKITDDAATLPEFEMTRIYFGMLEKNILESPELWLWSHNRWKRTREMFYEQKGAKDAERRLSHL